MTLLEALVDGAAGKRRKIETHGAGAPCEKKKEPGASIVCRLLADKWQIRATTIRNWRLVAGCWLLDIADAKKVPAPSGGETFFCVGPTPLFHVASRALEIGI